MPSSAYGERVTTGCCLSDPARPGHGIEVEEFVAAHDRAAMSLSSSRRGFRAR